MKVVPAADRMSAGQQPLAQMRIASPLAPMYRVPEVSSGQISQQLAGHEFDVLETDGEWVRGRGDDGYEGWIHIGFLDDSGVERSPAPRISLDCVTERPDGTRRSLPLRAFLRPDERVVDGEAIEASAGHARFPLRGDAIVESAVDRFRGTSYIWGGVTPWGADCSGLVQSAFALHGRMVPRDAWMQAQVGEPGPGDFAGLRAADLLFFSDRPDKKVTHVGMATGPNRLVHLALGRGGYAVEDLTSDEDYIRGLRNRFLFARRIL